MRVCPVCGKPIVGRSDKMYGSARCKNTFNNLSRRVGIDEKSDCIISEK